MGIHNIFGKYTVFMRKGRLEVISAEKIFSFVQMVLAVDTLARLLVFIWWRLNLFVSCSLGSLLNDSPTLSYKWLFPPTDNYLAVDLYDEIRDSCRKIDADGVIDKKYSSFKDRPLHDWIWI